MVTKSQFTKMLAVLVASSTVASLGFTQTMVNSTVLTDKIHRGEGVIDILQNLNSSQLNDYFTQSNRMMMFGIDVNDNASGNEKQSSLGTAIKSAKLAITTTAGDFTFKDFLTSTSSQLKEAGTPALNSFNTLFGQVGSSQITGTGPVDISRFDDVMWFENINFTGNILSAKMEVKFLDVGDRPNGASEQFFDFSGGFEDFALLSIADAALIEAANIGMKDAPSGINFTSGRTVIDAQVDAQKTYGGGGTNPSGGTNPGDGTKPGDTGGTNPSDGTNPGGGVPAAPAPPLVILAVMGALLAWRFGFQQRAEA